MKKLAKEPLLHFLLIGAGLFLVYGQTNNANTGDPEQRIVVSTGRIKQLANIFSKNGLRRLPDSGRCRRWGGCW